jgi:hypothetical protein
MVMLLMHESPARADVPEALYARVPCRPSITRNVARTDDTMYCTDVDWQWFAFQFHFPLNSKGQ